MSSTNPASGLPATSTTKNNAIWVRETRFGRWFLSTQTWYRYVLSQAVIDFKTLLGERVPTQGHILDAGCGQGLAFGLLEQHFQPATITGIDIDAEQVKKAVSAASQLTTPALAVHTNASASNLTAGSFDLILCHQLLHHTSQQQETLQEFYRLLRPGGILLVGESCRSFINSAPVRLLFRHPEMAQKDARGYIDLVRTNGFVFSETDIQTSRPWWSRRCLGMAQKLGIGLNNTEPTEILIVATKPH
ncbi:class I SAM-dependent methyltransferase [Cellvibrio fibrivorans]|uniref:SAM-dependent methyltransferase n=1 Tax=Cellvibrio fibrivorans TaxID=126350 RepID=A0ABU1UUJ1_9GAMM|nr:class I SAM-dependent methyltransferase [Cellvibrio fibrivorans]MDR7088792.1 SAM-dependent methyltransferase [Cellvibrio fibrivorans]